MLDSLLEYAGAFLFLLLACGGFALALLGASLLLGLFV